ncbi:MAG TPA: hypothetical protein VLI90_00475 [Tepidisphaeraceae bacterium]|nr:hypothetical protein [Tepidisphaeraceae bacterium]
MPSLNELWFTKLLADRQPPCVSIYLPMHRAAPSAKENEISYRDMVEQAKVSMRNRYDDRLIDQMAEKLHGIAGDNSFWVGDRDGLAVFASPDFQQVIELQQPVDPLCMVADTFHIKPLVRILQSADRFQVLCFTLNGVQLYEGDQHRLAPVPLNNVPQSPADVAGMRLSDATTATADFVQGQKQAKQGDAAADEPVNVQHFMQAVDRAIWENHSRRSRLPLVLIASEKHHDPFRRITRNQYLVDVGVMLDPKAIPIDRIRAEAWQVMEPRFKQNVAKLADQFRAAKAHHKGSDELMEVAQAAADGRVGTLLVRADAQIPGMLSQNSGFIEQARPEDPRADDVLDDLTELVLKRDGQVLVLPPEAMPTDTGVAAIYRY